MKFIQFLRALTILTSLSLSTILAGNVTITLVGSNPLKVNVKGDTGTEEAAAFSIFIYYNSTTPSDNISALTAANVDSKQLTTIFGWTTLFETKEIQQDGPYSPVGSSTTYNSRLSYAHSNLFDQPGNDYWPTDGVDVLILNFEPGGPGSAFIEVVGNNGLADNSANGHTVTIINNETSPLPVELTTFFVNSVKGTEAKLQWETSTEVNNYGFEIERATISDESEKMEWKKVAFVEGHGNSNSTKTYSFLDKNLVGGSKFKYRLKQIDFDGKFEFSDVVEVEIVPNKFELFQNYPNPFNPTTNIKFTIPENARIKINIYNVLGERVGELLNKELKAGFHQVKFKANIFNKQLTSGIYFYSIESENFSQVKKMMLLK
ncbi:MAG: hypothetical protein CR986_03920 [Ignavibacteriae bacterium]|nr:MAG: hypothetical protein CR986_03920 [Ignavibacteriota bacterium]